MHRLNRPSSESALYVYLTDLFVCVCLFVCLFARVDEESGTSTLIVDKESGSDFSRLLDLMLNMAGRVV